MVDGMVFGEVDFFISEYGIVFFFDVSFFGEFYKFVEGFFCDEVFVEVEDDVGVIVFV